MNTSKKVRFLALGAVIAALYAVLTYVAAAVNLAYGPVQFRFSEALTVLPVFTPAAIPGLTLGCVIANLGSPLGVVDWVFGPLATLLAALATYLVRDVKVKGLPILAPLPPVITNVVIVGFELAWPLRRGDLWLGELHLGCFWNLCPICGHWGAGGVLRAGSALDSGPGAHQGGKPAGRVSDGKMGVEKEKLSLLCLV